MNFEDLDRDESLDQLDCGLDSLISDRRNREVI